MTKKELFIELDNNVNALRENRLRVSNIVLKDLSNVKHLVDFVFLTNDKVSVKAAWVLEFVVKKQFDTILPFVDFLSLNLHKIQFGGAVRSMAKIVQLIIQKNDKKTFLTEKQEERFVEIAFDWLISKHKVAIKAYSMEILFLLGKKQLWIHTELKNILTKNMEYHSAAYKARARITLLQINKWHKKSC